MRMASDGVWGTENWFIKKYGIERDADGRTHFEREWDQAPRE
eukprot:gene8493-14328_t